MNPSEQEDTTFMDRRSFLNWMLESLAVGIVISSLFQTGAKASIIDTTSITQQSRDAILKKFKDKIGYNSQIEVAVDQNARVTLTNNGQEIFLCVLTNSRIKVDFIKLLLPDNSLAFDSETDLSIFGEIGALDIGDSRISITDTQLQIPAGFIKTNLLNNTNRQLPLIISTTENDKTTHRLQLVQPHQEITLSTSASNPEINLYTI